MTTTLVLAKVSQLAAGQWGLLTTAQAEREGVTRLHLTRLAGADILERVDRGVYATTSSPIEHRTLRAAWLALDPSHTAEERLADPIASGVVSHTSAAGLHRLGDLLDDRPEITLPHRKQTRRGIRLHRLTLTDSDVTFVDGLPTTTVERTVADLLCDGHDPEHIAQIIGQGVRRGVINVTDLAVHLEPSARRYGQADGPALVEHLLDLVGLSPTALVRDLANSGAGRELVAAGHYAGAASAITAISDALSTLMPGMLGQDKTSTNSLAGVLEGFKTIQAQMAMSVALPQFASMNTAGFRVATAAWEPSVTVAQHAASDVGTRSTAQAVAAVMHSDEPEGDE
ncbi:type IV toxin-antitoxin system AbiEi family antitoxin domain-containing protein [Sanguibacter antarcticus]|uniref:Putative AbiEi antitoxin of type IV toxin-antitoxin system n=1 Tax=Sanguibacter antarcticus TaxID=372484 RepID=A0A2A9E8U9_9MICO|nr:type IV toxin-antitoxin system AbiEi family antitoxin domain-containing protein [Sanguibacter antarcticus]PFG34652.1 putative AbiEi antitoxin of type IV toxin-antitoxin system [Sanguibacter antarcticus]